VPVAVQRDLVPGGCDLGRERRVALDLLTDEEERCACVRSAEQLERRRRSFRVWAVVECQRDAGRITQAQRDAERRGDGRNDRGRRRPAPRPSRSGAGDEGCAHTAIVERRASRATVAD